MSAWTPASEQPCARREIVANSTFPRSRTAIKIRPRYLLARWRTRSGTSSRAAPTRVASSAATPYTWGSTASALADEYRRATAPAGASGCRSGSSPSRRPSGAAAPASPGASWRRSSSLGLVALVVAIGLVSGGGRLIFVPVRGTNGKQRGKSKKQARVAATKPGVALGLAATGEVWVCVAGQPRRTAGRRPGARSRHQAGPVPRQGLHDGVRQRRSRPDDRRQARPRRRPATARSATRSARAAS